jgi:hypothetical protein
MCVQTSNETMQIKIFTALSALYLNLSTTIMIVFLKKKKDYDCVIISFYLYKIVLYKKIQ